jgi:hypothetical protein
MSLRDGGAYYHQKQLAYLDIALSTLFTSKINVSDYEDIDRSTKNDENWGRLEQKQHSCRRADETVEELLIFSKILTKIWRFGS